MRPNLICIGTFRAGTSWLFRVLKKHPDVFLPDEKELMFFTRHYQRGIEWYEKCFSHYNLEKYAADISPSYLSKEKVPKRMKKHLQDIKILAILRNPPDQIWSLYNLWITRNYTKMDIRSALQQKSELLNNVLYFEHLSNFLKFFDKKDILILFYEDLKMDPRAFLKSIYNYLEIENLFEEDFFKYWNKSRRPKSMLVEKITVSTGEFLHKAGLFSIKKLLKKTRINEGIKSINTIKLKENFIPEDIRSSINAYVKYDKENLSRLVSRDLSFWS